MDKLITVPVPEERVAEFFSMYGAWLAQPQSGDPIGAGQAVESARLAWDADSVDDAAWLYGKLSKNGRAIFDLLIDNAEEGFVSDDLALRLNIPNGSYGVAGTLAWPGRFSVMRNRRFPIGWEAPDGSTLYHMEESVASVFRAARERVTGAQ